ncbi:MAG: transporter substrate-binding domain-containing protein [Chloroflexi bacterium]|nr:transporter substrate-binding domain-containing protein [Chloroflexota bacterium]
MNRLSYIPVLILVLALLAACAGDEEEPAATPTAPTPTAELQEPTVQAATPAAENFKAIAIDAPFPPFSDFDDFGNVVGFDAELAQNLMARLGYDYEFVVTGFTGMLESIGAGEFDLAISAITNQSPPEGVIYSDPYLETGQVMVVLANEQELVSHTNLPPGIPIGVVADSRAGWQAATAIAGIPATDLEEFPTPGTALQALIDGQVPAVILDHDDAEHFTRTYYEQLKIAGGSGPEAWITHRAYVIAVDEDEPELLAALNSAIAEAKADGSIERFTRNWLVSKETLDAGESLIGTPEDMIVIGVVGALENVDPAAPPDLIGWEVKSNNMSGLYMFNAEDELVPVLAAAPPTVSEDRLEYTFQLREGLSFPDGSPFTASDVKASIDRAAQLGNWHVNTFLKDSNDDSLADADAVQVLGDYSVRFVLKQPAAHFLYVLATPPYFVVSEECYATDPEPVRNCNGIGRYEIIEWEANESLQMKANPQWPGEDRAAFENLQLRFYDDAEGLRNALELGAIDIAWGDLSEDAVAGLLGQEGVRAWDGPATFKSYLIFQQEETPWQTEALRQAVAYAVDRESLAALFGGRRQPLYSPLPASEPFSQPAEPARNLARAQELLQLAGYGPTNKLVFQLWYLNDGRYSNLEDAYAQRLKEQLEETGMITVDLQSAAWGTYSQQSSACEYTTYLFGWPPVGWPTRYPAPMGWLEFFVTDTDTLCSNYTSLQMDALIAEARQADPLDLEAQEEIYGRIQALWAEELPTLNLTQEAPQLVALNSIDGIRFDRMGLLHYETLVKTP